MYSGRSLKKESIYFAEKRQMMVQGIMSSQSILIYLWENYKIFFIVLVKI